MRYIVNHPSGERWCVDDPGDWEVVATLEGELPEFHDIVDGQVVPDLAANRLLKLEAIKVTQAERFLQGWSYDFGTGVGTHTLDMRDADDKTNWTLLLIKTNAMIGASAGAAPVHIRTATNEVITVTADVANTAMQQFLAWGENMLRHKWDLDAAVGATTSMAELDAVDITAGWPS